MEGVAEPEAIDTVMKLGMNHPMGPLALADLIGLDTCLSILEVLQRDLGDDKYRPCPLLRKYVAAGWLGRKSGRGFYRYEQSHDDVGAAGDPRAGPRLRAAELRPHTERWDAQRRARRRRRREARGARLLRHARARERRRHGLRPATYVAALEELAWGEPAVALLVAQSARPPT
jgi:3-hydroxyacyl-CoA dehydrogenase